MATFDKAIPPGQEGKITLKMDTRNASGYFSKNANVFSNDPEGSTVHIAMAATVKEYIRVSPGYHVILDGYYGEKVATTINISTVLDDPLKIKEVTSTIDDNIKYNLTTIQKNKEYALEISTGSGIKESVQGRVQVKTNSIKKPVFEILVTSSLKTEVVISPRYLYYGIIDTSKETVDPKSLMRSATVESARGNALTIEKVVAGDGIATSIESDPNNLKHTITITLDRNKLPKGTFKNQVTLQIQSNNRPESATIIIAGKVI